jgi:hypothetical protein
MNTLITAAFNHESVVAENTQELDNGSEVQDPVVQKLNFDEVRFF